MDHLLKKAVNGCCTVPVSPCCVSSSSHRHLAGGTCQTSTAPASRTHCRWPHAWSTCSSICSSSTSACCCDGHGKTSLHHHRQHRHQHSRVCRAEPTQHRGSTGDSSSSSESSSSLGRMVFGGGDGSFSRAQSTGAGPSSGGSSGNINRGSSGGSGGGASWALMGRVVQSDQLSLGASPRQRLVLLAAARQAGVDEQEMTRRMQELVTLLPDLSSLLFSLNPAILAQLSADTAAVAAKLIQLRLWFPTADVAAMVSRRPTLLLDDQFEHVDIARQRLLARLAPQTPPPPPLPSHTPPDAPPDSSSSSRQQASALTAAAAAAPGAPQAITFNPTTPGGNSSSSSAAGVPPPPPPLQACAELDALVSRQPLLLVADVDKLLDELARLMPGVAVVPLLSRNPSMLLMVQRGTQDLGPGAEFMGHG